MTAKCGPSRLRIKPGPLFLLVRFLCTKENEQTVLSKKIQPPKYAFLTSSLAARSLASPDRVMRPVSST